MRQELKKGSFFPIQPGQPSIQSLPGMCLLKTGLKSGADSIIPLWINRAGPKKQLKNWKDAIKKEQKELENWVIKDWVNSTPGLWLDMACTLLRGPEQAGKII